MNKTTIDTPRSAFISTYPPRKCGIATFTHDLLTNLMSQGGEDVPREKHFHVVAMKDNSKTYDFPPEVSFEIRDHYPEDYLEAAEFINLSAIDIVSLQHEYGIFGGNDGNHILHLLSDLKKPVVTTLHTVLDKPSQGQKETLDAILSLSTYVVVITQKASKLLKQVHGIPSSKITVIPHGTPDVPFLDSSYYKNNFQADGRLVLLTFGLLSANKGIEYVVEALPQVVKKHPDVLYFILGATHPNVKQHEGERYRISIENRVKELGLQKHVVFHNRFVSLEKLIQFLVAADIYITPYLSKEQISSGTLAYALAAGKAIISTPYWYAEDLLGKDRGMLVPFEDPKAISESILELLSNPTKRNTMRRKAYQLGRQMIWSKVANRYNDLFEQAISEYARKKITAFPDKRTAEALSLPDVKLDYLLRLTDDTGVFQHALYRTPNRYDGYTTDDCTRALIVAVMNHKLFQESKAIDLIHTYLSFLHYAIDPEKKRVRNCLSYNRTWLDDAGSEDSHGRTIWSLGYTIWQAPDDAVQSLANHLFKHAIVPVLNILSPRAIAYNILGCIYYLKRFSRDTEINNIVTGLGQRLSQKYADTRTDEWRWFEDILTYSNARMPQALLAVGQYLNNETMISQGLESLEWLLQIQTIKKTGHISLIGNSAWYKKGGKKSKYDQQPVDALCLLEACYQAYQVTGDESWRSKVDTVFAWFLGKNDRNECLYDFKTGGCFDGLQRWGLNQNQGGESTISWLVALHIMYQITHQIPVIKTDKAEK
ncbi:glycosyltransferase family 4 protein [bacterium]|nr:glycosyltransferase family 4 protein [bacterium]